MSPFYRLPPADGHILRACLLNENSKIENEQNLWDNIKSCNSWPRTHVHPYNLINTCSHLEMAETGTILPGAEM